MATPATAASDDPEAALSRADMDSDSEPYTADDGADCVLVSADDGTVVWASPGVDAVFGRSADDIVGQSVRSDALGAALPDPSGASDSPATHDLTVTTPDGERSLSVTVETLADPGALAVYHCRTDAPEQLDLRSVLSRVTDGIVAFDTEWRYTYVNDHAEAILGQPRESLLGTTIWEQFPAVADATPQRAFERAMETQEPVGFEWHGPATETWFELRAFPSATGLSVYFRDVTERKRHEAALERERDLVEQLLLASPVGICVLAPDGQFTRVNERAADILGVDRETLLDESFREPTWEVRHPDGRPLDEEEFPFSIALRTREPTVGHEQTLRRADGTRISVSVGAAPVLSEAGEVARVVVTFRDITEQKVQAKATREREQQLQSIFDSTLDALVLADDDGTYVSVNPAACDLYGLPEDELVGRNVADFAPEGYDVAAAWEAFIAEGTGRGEFPLVRPDGEVRIVDFAATADVAPGLHLSALRDITERKEDERRLADQRDELERLANTNDAIRRTIQSIVGETTRDTIEASVCEGLVEVEHYPVAVTSQTDHDDGTAVGHVAGLTSAQFDALRTTEASPLEAAMRTTATTGESTVLRNLQANPSVPSVVRETARTLGVQTVCNVAIEHEGVVYGVLSVGGDTTDAFGPREQAVFVELGQLVGTALDAIQAKKLLHATAFLELELTVTGADAPLLALNERVGGRWTIEGIVPIERSRYLLYVDVDDADPAAIERAASTLPAVESVRVVGDGPHRVLEARVNGTSPIAALIDGGGQIRGGAFEDGEGQFVVDVTLDTDVREYVDRIEQSGVDVWLRSKREGERDAEIPWDSDGDDHLTDRQRAALEAAYHAGYFDWPRRQTTGEKLAASLDISSSTFNQHLRVATAKVLDRYFSSTTPSVDHD
ncbi:PAS domain S-box protein [Haloarcula marina]|uniref:PAS domain S-box protein n=1 Tax=Haloarcula marina TaxID=2961574 RepID=UPI0020B8668C|nr:PAS domain S-box protein [Halomicroarcula marina]